jgi:hypothetical protein
LSNVLVLWHWSHEADVEGWFRDLPLADTPLWQVAQVPGATMLWLNFAPSKLLVL